MEMAAQGVLICMSLIMREVFFHMPKGLVPFSMNGLFMSFADITIGWRKSYFLL